MLINISHYIKHPFQVIMANWTLLLWFSLVVIFNHLISSGSLKPVLAPEWFFVSLPQYAFTAIGNLDEILTVIGASLLKSIFSSVLANDMLLVYSGHRRGFLQCLKTLQIKDVAWFVFAECFIYVIFGIIAVTMYMPARYLWTAEKINTLPICLILFVALYPIFYICLAAVWMLSVFPISSQQKAGLVKYLITGNRFVKLYGFYGIRVIMESFFLFVLPAITSTVFHRPYLADIFAGIGLILPLALIRGSAYEFKLDLLGRRQEVRKLFDGYYQEVRNNI